MSRRLIAFSLLLMLAVLAPAQAAPLTIAAAADLRAAMPELLQIYARDQPDVETRVTFGSSGKLATQIEQGAPFDIYFSADEAYPQRLHAQGLALAAPQRYAIGRLAIWVRTSGAPKLEDLVDARYARIAIANPEHAPYGARARQVLQRAGEWDALLPRIVYAENVAQALQWVDSGAADVGVVALALLPQAGGRDADKRRLIDAQLHDPLWQAVMVVRSSPQRAQAQAFQDLVLAPEGREILQRFGFDLPDVAH